MPKTKAALVLAGGGSNAAFQAGVEKVLREERGYEWDAVYGVSAGALNAILIAQGRFDELKDLWTHRADKLVKKRKPWKMAWGVLLGQGGLYDNTKLRKLVAELVKGTPYLIPAKVGFVDLAYGEYAVASHEHPDFANLVVASTSIPITFDQPQAVGGNPLGDGGLRNMAPVTDAVFDGHQCIVVVLNSAATLRPRASLKGLGERLSRALEIMLSEIADNDIQDVARVNALVAAGAGNGTWRHVDLIVVRPSRDLGDSMDFSLKHTREAIMQGEVDARALSNL